MEPSKYPQPKENAPLWIMFDGGNVDVKAMLHLCFTEPKVFPHSVRKVSPTEYTNLAAAYKHRPAEFNGTAIFKLNDQGYVVGKHNLQSNQGQRITGPGKYLVDHYRPMFIAALLQTYPKSHGNVHVVALHPPRLDEESRKNLWKCLRGKHVVTLADGRIIEYNVPKDGIIMLEEPVAALQNFLLTQKGETYANPGLTLTPGMQILTLDIGGGLSAFVPCLIDDAGKIEVNLSATPPIDKGIEDVTNAFEEELKAAYPKELAAITRIPVSIMHVALVNGEAIQVRGEPLKCKPQIANAMRALTNPVSAVYHNNYADGVAYSAVVISGGGAASSFEYLKTNVLQHNHVYSSDPNLSLIRFSGVFGASKGLISFLRRSNGNGAPKA